MKESVPCLENHSIAFAQYGNRKGYPILVQHGLIASIEDGSLFQRLVELGANVVCAARPGYGDSAPVPMAQILEWADMIAPILGMFELEQFDVLGISSGAPYSYALGYRFPNRVRNIYILSGIPALYDARVVSHWQYPINKNADLEGLQQLAHELCFAKLTEQDLARRDIRDSMRYHCFGIAQDWKIRCLDWGFSLGQVTPHVSMRHSQQDGAVPFVTAEMTAGMLPNCTFAAVEGEIHFSEQLLNELIDEVIAPQLTTR